MTNQDVYIQVVCSLIASGNYQREAHPAVRFNKTLIDDANRIFHDLKDFAPKSESKDLKTVLKEEATKNAIAFNNMVIR